MLNYDLPLQQTSINAIRPAWADFTGLIASIGCAIHCAAMPIIIGYLPTFGLGWVATQDFHQVMAVICSLLAVAAFVPGWRKHQRFLPAVLGLTGIMLLTSHAIGVSDCCADVACSVKACELCVETERSSSGTFALPQVNPDASWPNSTATTSGYWKSLRWFATPLGGFFLICAHLINHRFACRCCRGEQPGGTEI